MFVGIRGTICASVVAACATPAHVPTSVADPHEASPASHVRDALVNALVKTHGRAAAIEAPHAGAIVTLAVTADGRAAVSCDELGGIRLWPTFDGSTEPRAVELPRAQQLAIAPDPRGFVIAMIDDVGGLVIQVVDRNGLTVQRASLGIDPGFAGVAMSEQGTIAWRHDQRILRIAADGSTSAQLAPDAGQRVLSVSITGRRAVAVLETVDSTTQASTRRARWLAIGDKLAWGAWIDAGNDVGATLAISPNGARIASLVGNPGTTQVNVIDATSGAQASSQTAGGAESVRFVDDDHLVLGTAGFLAWLDLTKPAPKGSNATAGGAGMVASDRGLLAVGGNRAITANLGQLVIATPRDTEYLGYDMQSTSIAVAAPDGKLLIGAGDSFALLDRELRASAAPDLAIPTGSAIADVRWLAGDEWLVETSRPNDGKVALQLVNVASHQTIPIGVTGKVLQTLLHEKSTALVTLSGDGTAEVLHHEPGKLDRIATIAKPPAIGYERADVIPVVPALAGGTHVVVVHRRDRLTLRWVVDPHVLDKGTAITIDGTLAAIDVAGHAYVWQNDAQGALALTVFLDGKPIASHPTASPTAAWPDRKGTQLLQIAPTNIALVALDGTRKWARSLQGATSALWLDDGALAVISMSGIARLDPETGDVLAAKCGWKFSLSRKPHTRSAPFEPICTQLQ